MFRSYDHWNLFRNCASNDCFNHGQREGGSLVELLSNCASNYYSPPLQGGAGGVVCGTSTLSTTNQYPTTKTWQLRINGPVACDPPKPPNQRGGENKRPPPSGANFRILNSRLVRTLIAVGFLTLLVPSSAQASTPPTPAELARRIDAALATSWQQAGVRPAPLSDDAEFLRRITLDLTGRIPAVNEARSFLDDKSTDKRARLVNRLLSQPGYALQFSRVWRDRWLPQSAAQFEELRPEFEDWLRQRLSTNTPYDRMVRELLCVSSHANAQARDAEARQSGFLFLQANEFKPENLAGSTARIFLGVNIECAQCHDHPHARWTRRQFWEFAAFFTDANVAGKQELAIPGSKEKVEPHCIDGSTPTTTPGKLDALASRTRLVDWMTSSGNAYFSRNLVNQVWTYLFGAGLVESMDDPLASAQAGRQELLDQLAEAFTASGFDLQYLIRALTLTRAYQLSSAGAPDTRSEESDQPFFERAPLRSQTGEQLYDSLLRAGGMDAASVPAVTRSDFLARFRQQSSRATEANATILQSLARMNGVLVSQAVDPDHGKTVGAAADAPFLNHAQRIESLYLAALTRRPRPDELKRLTPMLEECKTAAERRRVLSAIFWALLNCHEFAVNH